MFKQILNNQHGMSLMEVMIAASISIVVAMGVMKINETSQKGLRSVKLTNELREVEVKINGNLLDREKCSSASFVGHDWEGGVTPGSLADNHPEMNGIQAYTEFSADGSLLVIPTRMNADGTAVVGSQTLEVPAAATPTVPSVPWAPNWVMTKYRLYDQDGDNLCYMRIDFRKVETVRGATAKSFGTETKDVWVVLNCELEGAGNTITTCVSANTFSDGMWQENDEGLGMRSDNYPVVIGIDDVTSPQSATSSEAEALLDIFPTDSDNTGGNALVPAGGFPWEEDVPGAVAGVPLRGIRVPYSTAIIFGNNTNSVGFLGSGDTIYTNDDASLQIGTNLTVGANTTVGGTLGVTGVTNLASALNVDGNTQLGLNAANTVLIPGNTTIGGNTTVGGTLGVTGVSTLATTTVNGVATLNNNLNVNGNTTLGNTAGDSTTVNGTATMNNNFNVNGNTTLGNNVADNTTVSGSVNLNNTLNVSGATTLPGGINGGLSITGNTTTSGTLSGSTGSISNNLYIGGSAWSNGYNTWSDKRLKKDIKALENATEKLSEIRGVTYFMRHDEFTKMKFSKDKQIGFIAQEIKEIFPEFVAFSEETGYYSVDYAKFTPVLVEAFKEQLAEIKKNRIMFELMRDGVKIKNAEQDKRLDKLEKENKALRKDLKAVQRRLDEMMKLIEKKK